MKKKLLFIHIAKTGGSSIRKMLNQSSPKVNYDCIHNQKLISFDDNKIFRKAITSKVQACDYEQTAFFVRNPYQRLISCYNYFRDGGLNQFDDKNFQGDQKKQQIIKQQFPTFQDCCHNLKQFSQVVTHAKPMTESMYESCQLSVDNKSIIQGRLESYSEDVIKLFSILGLPIEPEDIQKINPSSRENECRYDDSMKEQVYKFYQDDFESFKYLK